jgi:ABC-type lipopolysaccharide export system ATPase subunit
MSSVEVGGLRRQVQPARAGEAAVDVLFLDRVLDGVDRIVVRPRHAFVVSKP